MRSLMKTPCRASFPSLIETLKRAYGSAFRLKNSKRMNHSEGCVKTVVVAHQDGAVWDLAEEDDSVVDIVGASPP